MVRSQNPSPSPRSSQEVLTLEDIFKILPNAHRLDHESGSLERQAMARGLVIGVHVQQVELIQIEAIDAILSRRDDHVISSEHHCLWPSQG